MTKERSRAVAMMVLHMSSHITSGGKQVAQCNSTIPICISLY